MTRNNEIAVIDLIQEEPGSGLTVDQILEQMPKSKNKAQEFLLKLQEYLKNDLLETQQLEIRKKRIQAKIDATETGAAIKKMKKDITRRKKQNARLGDILEGARKMAKAMGVDISGIKALNG